MSGQHVNWFILLADALAGAEREQSGSTCPVVDHEVMAPADGGPEDFTAWCICRSPEEKRQFIDTGLARFVSRLKKGLLAAGFPEPALASLTVLVASRSEMAAGLSRR
ncbi:MAG TPA: hypothetical protein VGM73_06315 [Candidatus Didemnitutus sp.]|jgi:hypothetical protein